MFSYGVSSLPSRERGLKFIPRYMERKDAIVAPLAGAWIEIAYLLICASGVSSLPSRERGLKSEGITKFEATNIVAPLAGAWIEIRQAVVDLVESWGRSPRGSVD